MASGALCCFLCHETVHFTDKNPTDFSNHMAIKHKATFNMELSLAVSLMDDKEKQKVMQIVWENYVKKAPDISSGALCCFLCHEMVHFQEKNSINFSNHMETKHQAFFKLELPLAVSLMDEIEKQLVTKVVWKNYVDHKKGEGKKNKGEKQIQQKIYISEKDETSVDNNKVMAEDEYQLLHPIKEEAPDISSDADTSATITIELVETTTESDETKIHMSAENFTKERKGKFNCELCYSKLSSNGSLGKHMRAVHEGVKFCCEECKKWFSSKTNLRRHNNVFHPISKIATYNCKQCFKPFNQKINLEVHMGVHTEVKANVCSVCKIGFTTKYHQKRHFSRQHGSRSEKNIFLSKHTASKFE